MGKKKEVDNKLSEKAKRMEDEAMSMISDAATDLYEKLPSRKERPLSEEEEKILEFKRKARQEAAGKLAGWGDYKFDWEK